MKKILYDLIATQPIKTVKFHGGGEYSKVIFVEMVTANLAKKEQIEIIYNPDIQLDLQVQDICRENNIRMIECRKNMELTKILEEGKYDLFYSGLPYMYFDLKIPVKTKFVYTIHGLRGLEIIHDKFMTKYVSGKDKIKDYLKKYFVQYLVEKRKNQILQLMNITSNKEVFTDSEFSKYSILKFFPQLQSQNIKVYYAPYKIQCLGDEKNTLAKNNINKNGFILLINGDRWEKNTFRAALALDSLIQTHDNLFKNIKVLICGVSQEKMYLESIENKDKFILKGYVPIEELEVFYKNAHLFLYPTLNEGFGYPPIEAMKYETLTASSAISSITEVCGDSLMYFNPYDINEIQNKILQSFDEKIRNRHILRMRIKYQDIKNRQEEDMKALINAIVC